MTSTNNDSSATTETTGTSTPTQHEMAELLRAWTATGLQLYDRQRANREGHAYAAGPDIVAAAIDTLDWQTMPASGSLSLPFTPGTNIRHLITEMGLSQVSRVAWNATVPVRDDVERSSSLYGLLGIEAVHNGFPVRLFAVDRGTDLLMVAADAPRPLAVALDPTAGHTPTH